LPGVISSDVQSSGSRNILIGMVTRSRQDVWGNHDSTHGRTKTQVFLSSLKRPERFLSVQRSIERVPRFFPQGKAAEA